METTNQDLQQIVTETSSKLHDTTHAPSDLTAHVQAPQTAPDANSLVFQGSQMVSQSSQVQEVCVTKNDDKNLIHGIFNPPSDQINSQHAKISQDSDASSLAKDEDVTMIDTTQDSQNGVKIAHDQGPTITDSSTSTNASSQQQEELSEEAKEKLRDEGKWKNYVPTDQKRPIDEFYDLKSILTLREEVVTEDGGIVKYIVQEGKGSYIGLNDDVFYKHETRFDNGQLVDFAEKRNAIEKFQMGDIRFHEYYKIVMRTMKKGEIAWIKFSKIYHKGIYHASTHFVNRPEEEKKLIGEDIYIRFFIQNIKRNPQIKDQNTFEGLSDYLNQVREVCKELMEEGEYANAQSLYQRVYALYKNMTKKMRDNLNEEQRKIREEAMHLLCVNLSLTHFKRNNFKDAIKCARESLEFNKENPKAYFRLALALKSNGEFDDAKEQLVIAIKLSPADKNLRDELKKITELKQSKEKEWYTKMNGFYSSQKMVEIERRDYEEAILREKLNKKHFSDM
eukprot:403362337